MGGVCSWDDDGMHNSVDKSLLVGLFFLRIGTEDHIRSKWYSGCTRGVSFV